MKKKEAQEKKDSKGRARAKKSKPKKILKKSKMTYKVPEYRGESIWNQENKFFKGAIANEIL